MLVCSEIYKRSRRISTDLAAIDSETFYEIWHGNSNQVLQFKLKVLPCVLVSNLERAFLQGSYLHSHSLLLFGWNSLMPSNQTVWAGDD